MKKTFLALLLSFSVNAMEETALVPGHIAHTEGFQELKNMIVEKIRIDKMHNNNKSSLFDQNFNFNHIQEITKWKKEERDALFKEVNNIIDFNQAPNRDFIFFSLFSIETLPALEFAKKVLGPNPINVLNVFQHYSVCVKQTFLQGTYFLYNENASDTKEHFLKNCVQLFKDNNFSFLYLPLNFRSMLIAPNSSEISKFIKEKYEYLSKLIKDESNKYHQDVAQGNEEECNADKIRGRFDFEYFCSVYFSYEIIKEKSNILNLIQATRRAKQATDHYPLKELLKEETNREEEEKISALIHFIDYIFPIQIRNDQEIKAYIDLKEGVANIPPCVFRKLILSFDKEGIPVPEILKGRVDENTSKLKAITFIEDIAKIDFKEAQLEELPLVQQNQIIQDIEKELVVLPKIPRKDFSGLKKDFIEFLEDEDYETIEHLVKSDFPLMRHVLKCLVEEEKDLLKKAPSYLSEMIKKKYQDNEKHEEEKKTNKKSKKNKESMDIKAEKAIVIIDNAQYKNKIYPVLNSDYRKETWYKNRKNIMWTELSKGLKELGAFVRIKNNKQKITFYIAGSKEEPCLVDQNRYNEIDGTQNFKHDVTLTSHVNHEDHEILDPGFIKSIQSTLDSLTL